MASVVGFALVSAPRGASAAPDKTIYELQERCGRSAAAAMAEDRPGEIVKTKTGDILTNYESHYSPELNKCFVLEKHSISRREKGVLRAFNSEALADILENKTYGVLANDLDDERGKQIQHADAAPATICEVNGAFCSSAIEWHSLIKPYIGDQP